MFLIAYALLFLGFMGFVLFIFMKKHKKKIGPNVVLSQGESYSRQIVEAIHTRNSASPIGETFDTLLKRLLEENIQINNKREGYLK